jgi:hypothetical protein
MKTNRIPVELQWWLNLTNEERIQFRKDIKGSNTMLEPKEINNLYDKIKKDECKNTTTT